MYPTTLPQGWSEKKLPEEFHQGEAKKYDIHSYLLRRNGEIALVTITNDGMIPLPHSHRNISAEEAKSLIGELFPGRYIFADPEVQGPAGFLLGKARAPVKYFHILPQEA